MKHPLCLFITGNLLMLVGAIVIYIGAIMANNGNKDFELVMLAGIGLMIVGEILVLVSGIVFAFSGNCVTAGTAAGTDPATETTV